ncbi:MAG TPA: hypothetical protein VIR33_10680 [Thermopolyspora sp.]|jgi:hypothetical protein
MGTTAKGVAGGLATLDGDGTIPAAQIAAAAAVDDVATADADTTYDQGTADLINELKTQLNDLLAKLRTAGYLASS